MIIGALDIDYPDYIDNEHEIYNMVSKLASKTIVNCPDCNHSVGMHGTYKRNIIISEFDVIEITIVQVRCKKCKKVHAVIPKFISPNKQYNLQMIQDAIESKELSSCPADTSTIRRWKVCFK